MLAARRRKKTKGVSYVIGMDPMGLKRGVGGKGGSYVAKLRLVGLRVFVVEVRRFTFFIVRQSKPAEDHVCSL